MNPTKTFSETELRAAQPNLHRGQFFAHACKSRRAPRPRKPDETLSRHGLGARRVALLAPRGVFNRYRYPLSYVGAITKILVKLKCKSRILGDVNSIPSGGGVPEGRRGSVTPMSGDDSLFISLSTTQPPSEPPRDVHPIRSVLEPAEHLIRSVLDPPLVYNAMLLFFERIR